VKENSIEDRIEEKYTRYINCETDILELTIEEAIFILKKDASVHYVEDLLQEAYKVILSDYKRALKENEELLEVKVSTSAHNRILELEKENEELTISNKEIDKECSRLEEKEVKLINENEHYKDLIYALKTYYDITEEDLEKCIKNDR